MIKIYDILPPSIKYAFVGILNTATDFLIFVCLIKIFGLHALIANSLSFMIAVIQSFIINQNWTFKKNKNSMSFNSKFTRFFIVSILGLFCSNLVIYILAPVMNVFAAKAVAVLVVFLVTYTANQKYVFFSEK